LNYKKRIVNYVADELNSKPTKYPVMVDEYQLQNDKREDELENYIHPETTQQGNSTFSPQTSQTIIDKTRNSFFTSRSGVSPVSTSNFLARRTMRTIETSDIERM